MAEGGRGEKEGPGTWRQEDGCEWSWAVTQLSARRGVEESGLEFADGGVLAAAGPHDAVEERHAEDRSRLSQPAGHLAVLGTRGGIAGGMVVADDRGAGPDEDGRLEDLARVHERGRGGSHGDHLVRDRSVAAVEVERHEVLGRVVSDHAAHEVDDLRGPPDGGLDAGRATDVPDGDLANEVDALAIGA